MNAYCCSGSGVVTAVVTAKIRNKENTDACFCALQKWCGILLPFHGAIHAATTLSICISCVLHFCHHCCCKAATAIVPSPIRHPLQQVQHPQHNPLPVAHNTKKKKKTTKKPCPFINYSYACQRICNESPVNWWSNNEFTSQQILHFEQFTLMELVRIS